MSENPALQFGCEKEAARTDSPDYKDPIERLKDPAIVRLLHAAIGMATEAGEFADAVKKHVFYGAPLDTINLIEEMGDQTWYQRIACNALNITLAEVIQLNVAKLRARFPEKFTEAAAINRDIDKEREVLEDVNA